MSGQLNLTFISTRFLFPTDSGGKIRTTQILRGLRGGAFRIALLMPSTVEDRERFADQIDSVCDELLIWNQVSPSRFSKSLEKLVSVFDELPIPVKTDWDATGAALVHSAIDNEPDVVVFDFPHSAVLGPNRIGIPSVMFTHNIESEIFLRHWQVARFPVYKMIWRAQYRKMHRFEKSVLSRFSAVVAVSERDREFFRDEYDISNCGVIPTGVDTGFFAYNTPQSDSQVVFCGSMDWMANIDGIEYFFDNVWSLIREKNHDARMKVVGRAPPSSMVRRINALAPEWEFTDFVDDVRDHIGGSGVFVIPLRVGGGTRIKAFEAMAMGTPVVSTSIGIEGLPVENGKHYLEADDAAMFAEHVVSLLKDAELRKSMSESARYLVEGKFGFRSAAKAFEEICLSTVDR